jgi:hypothetical protein
MDLIVGNIPLITIRYNEDPTKAPTMVRQIGEIRTSDSRMIVEHEIPGMQGNVFQDMGRGPVKISFNGSFYGRNATEDMSTLRQYYLEGSPVFFYSDFSTISDIVNVIIDFLEITKVVGEINKLEYSITLRESVSQPPQDAPPPSQENEAKEWADTLVDENGPAEEDEGAGEEGTKEEGAGEEGAEEEGTGEEGAEEEGTQEESTEEEGAEEEGTGEEGAGEEGAEEEGTGEEGTQEEGTGEEGTGEEGAGEEGAEEEGTQEESTEEEGAEEEGTGEEGAGEEGAEEEGTQEESTEEEGAEEEGAGEEDTEEEGAEEESEVKEGARAGEKDESGDRIEGIGSHFERVKELNKEREEFQERSSTVLESAGIIAGATIARDTVVHGASHLRKREDANGAQGEEDENEAEEESDSGEEHHGD